MQEQFPGTVIAIDIGPIRHVGIVSDKNINGWPTVISASKRTRKVVEESLFDFTKGRRFYVLDIFGQLPWEEVLQRARSQIGKRWNLFRTNCEHFVRWAHGLKPTSPQLQTAVALLVFAVGIGWVLTRR